MLSAAAITEIIGGVQAAIAAAPQIEAIATAAKAWFQSLFENGLITVATQNAMSAHVDAIIAAFANGQTPPEFSVEAHPS